MGIYKLYRKYGYEKNSTRVVSVISRKINVSRHRLDRFYENIIKPGIDLGSSSERLKKSIVRVDI